jgi:hypothetical protein
VCIKGGKPGQDTSASKDAIPQSLFLLSLSLEFPSRFGNSFLSSFKATTAFAFKQPPLFLPAFPFAVDAGKS